MGLFDHFPYTNIHEMNLDWIMQMMKDLEDAWGEFVAGNSLTFADPLLHDLTSTYAKNTIVLDENGNAYLSLKAVPVGVNLSNTEYWLMVFDYEAFLEKVNKNFTDRYYRDENRAKTAMSVGDWLTLDDVLYKVTAAIAVDDLLEVDVNIEHFTLEDFIKAFMQSATQMIQQYKDDIDASELAFTTNLQAQFDAAIGAITVDSEVILARETWYGVTYPTLKDAQNTQCKRIMYRCVDSLDDEGLYEKGSIGGSGQDATYYEDSRMRTPLLRALHDIQIEASSSEMYIAFYDEDGSYVSNTGWITEGFIVTGSLFRVLLTEDHTTNTLHTISEIFAMFTFSNYPRETQFVNSELIMDLFEHGSYSLLGVKNSLANNRIRTKNILYAVRGFKITGSGTTRTIIIFYDNAGNVTSTTTWSSSNLVPAGSLFKILASFNENDNVTYKSLSEVFATLTTTLQPDVICDNVAKVSEFAILATISITDGTLRESSNTLVFPYIKCNKKLLCIMIDNGYKVFAQGLDSNKNVITGNILGGFFGSEQCVFVDTEPYSYITLALRKSDDSSMSVAADADKIHLYYGNDFKYPDHNIIALCKDGINMSDDSYAPMYPSSGLQSFRKAFLQGFRGALIHLQFTSDGVPVVFHNLNINSKATNIDGTAIGTTVSVQNSTIADLDNYDFGYKYGYPGTKISRLTDVLEFIKMSNFRLFVEPTTTLTDSEENDFIDILTEYGLLKNCGYYAEHMTQANRYHSKVPTAPIFMYAATDAAINTLIPTLGLLTCPKYIYTVTDNVINASTYAAMKAANIHLMIQTKDSNFDSQIEPYSLYDVIHNFPAVEVIVSQIIPCNQILDFID